MKGSVFPGDLMELHGVVDDVSVDDVGCGWASLSLALRVGEEEKTTCTLRVALPVDETDNPWRRRASQWQP
jgi:hypothetical protein